jgi:general secretion pathway protein E
MIGYESSRFVAHLRQNNHLTETSGSGQRDKQGGGDRAIDDIYGKLWEHTNLSASEFADETARFYGLERVAHHSRSVFCAK